MSCPKCKSENITESEILYCIVTYNPTVPYADNVTEYICNDCNNKWFEV